MKKAINKNQQKALNIILGIIFITSPFAGILLSVIAIGDDLENYVEPYKFSFIWGAMGLILGYIVSYKLKPIVMTVNKKVKDYSQLRLFLAMGFIGVFLLLGVKVNSSNSSLHNTFNSTLINKTQRQGSGRITGYNKLHFLINERPIELRCHRKIWENHNLGDKISIEFYKSKMGFHYWKIKND